MDFVRSDDPNTKLTQYDNAAYLPSRDLVLPIDKKAVLENGVVSPKDADKIVSQMEIKLTGNYITKDELMILDMLANNNWKRPIYFAVTVGREKYMNLQEYFQTDGLAYRIVPIKTPSQNVQVGSVRTDVMYDNMMNKFKWGNMNDPKVYLDENNTRMLMNVRNSFLKLAEGLIDEGKRDSAVAVLDRCNELIPDSKVPYNYWNMLMAESYYKAAGKTLEDTVKNKPELSLPVNTAYVAKANDMIRIMAKSSEEELLYYFNLKPQFRATVQQDLQNTYFIMRSLADMATHYGEMQVGDEVIKKINDLMSVFQPELVAPSEKQ